MDRRGYKVGPYTLLESLGEGGFGEVWLAEERTAFTIETFAIKLPFNKADVGAVRKEVETWKLASGHPNVLRFVKADIYDGQIALISEYCPDGSLVKWLARHGGCAPTQLSAITMVLGILAGLGHLHSRDIIHRDLKPDNILLQGETPRLADFGLSRILKSHQSTNNIVGTLPFVAPETFDGIRSETADLWAAGVILFLLLSGRLPFKRENEHALIKAIINDDPAPLPEHLPKPLLDIVLRSLKKSPADRFQSAAAMHQALKRIVSGNEEKTEPVAAGQFEPQQQTLKPGPRRSIAQVVRPTTLVAAAPKPAQSLKVIGNTHVPPVAKVNVAAPHLRIGAWLAIGLVLLMGSLLGYLAWQTRAQSNNGNTKNQSVEATNTVAGSPSSELRPEALRYYLEAEQQDGRSTRTAGVTALPTGRFRFSFLPHKGGYLYIIAPGADKSPTMFLSAKFVRSNGPPFAFPSKDKWLNIGRGTMPVPFTIIFSPVIITNPNLMGKTAGYRLTAIDEQALESLRGRFKNAVEMHTEAGSTMVITTLANTELVVFDIILNHMAQGG